MIHGELPSSALISQSLDIIPFSLYFTPVSNNALLLDKANICLCALNALPSIFPVDHSLPL